MSWTTLTTPPAWNVTDTELLKRLQYHLLENGDSDADGITFLTPMFTQAQLLATMNQRQEKFTRDTSCVLTRASQASTPNIARYILPTDWIHTRRLTWSPVGGPIKSLARTDTFQLDHDLSDWQQNSAAPVSYNDGSNLPTLTVEIAKSPNVAGSMTLLYVAQPVSLDGSGVNLTIPDEAEGAVLWGALADLLGADGESHDPERAAFAQTMYQMTVEMIDTLLEGAPDA